MMPFIQREVSHSLYLQALRRTASEGGEMITHATSTPSQKLPCLSNSATRAVALSRCPSHHCIARPWFCALVFPCVMHGDQAVGASGLLDYQIPTFQIALHHADRQVASTQTAAALPRIAHGQPSSPGSVRHPADGAEHQKHKHQKHKHQKHKPPISHSQCAM